MYHHPSIHPFYEYSYGNYFFVPYDFSPFQGPHPQWTPYEMFASSWSGQPLKDYGAQPLVLNIAMAAKQNRNFRTALWTGNHFQITLMSLHPGEDIGLEMHPDVDQFLRIEQGTGIVQMGGQKEKLDFVQPVYKDSIVVIPAGTWHNLTNTGPIPLKLYSIYAPPNHPKGTVHHTKAEAIAAEDEYGND